MLCAGLVLRANLKVHHRALFQRQGHNFYNTFGVCFFGSFYKINRKIKLGGQFGQHGCRPGVQAVGIGDANVFTFQNRCLLFLGAGLGRGHLFPGAGQRLALFYGAGG